jgi:hypothetical protein
MTSLDPVRAKEQLTEHFKSIINLARTMGLTDSEIAVCYKVSVSGRSTFGDVMHNAMSNVVGAMGGMVHGVEEMMGGTGEEGQCRQQ